jgi:hypothetical protein
LALIAGTKSLGIYRGISGASPLQCDMRGLASAWLTCRRMSRAGDNASDRREGHRLADFTKGFGQSSRADPKRIGLEQGFQRTLKLAAQISRLSASPIRCAGTKPFSRARFTLTSAWTGQHAIDSAFQS